MTTVQLTGVGLAFGDRDLLQDVHLVLTDSKRMALTGANGSGKTTLLRIIRGETEPDRGRVSVPNDIRIGYLPQTGLALREGTLYEEAERAFDWVRDFIDEREQIGERLRQEPESEETEGLLERFHQLQEHIEASDYYAREGQIHYVLTGLGFTDEDFHRPIAEFSGGWRMRIALARILLERPTQLLLDEPTNFLDIEARMWLIEFLKSYPGGYVVVSHDRHFLDETTNEVAELFMGKLTVYSGNFSKYEAVRHQELAELEKAYREQQARIAQLEEFIARFRYNAAKASLVQSRIKELEKMERIELPESMKPIHFSFPDSPGSGKKVIRVEGLTKSFGETVLFNGLELEIERGEKVVVTGKNGSGKSTLLRILAGHDEDYGGSVQWGARVKPAYFCQDDTDRQTGSGSVLEDVESVAPTEMMPQVRNLLGAFLFRGDDVYKSLSVLSGGERSRLALVKLLLEPANLLILVEPTNHLDMSSKDVLLNALKSFSGTVIFVSHDRRFISELAGRVVELSRPHERAQTAVRNFPGDYEYYLWRLEQEASHANGEAGPGQRAAVSAGVEHARERARAHSDANGTGDHQQLKQRRNALQKIKRQEETLMARIEELDAEHERLQAQLADPEVYADGERIREVKDQLQRCESEQEKLTEEWQELEEQRSELEAEQ